VNCVSHAVVENLKQFAFKGDKSRAVRRTFWLIKVVPTWKKFGKRCTSPPKPLIVTLLWVYISLRLFSRNVKLHFQKTALFITEEHHHARSGDLTAVLYSSIGELQTIPPRILVQGQGMCRQGRLPCRPEFLWGWVKESILEPVVTARCYINWRRYSNTDLFI
jgi:hypothetical protein